MEHEIQPAVVDHGCLLICVVLMPIQVLLLLGMPLVEGFDPPKSIFQRGRLNGKSYSKPILHSHSKTCNKHQTKMP